MQRGSTVTTEASQQTDRELTHLRRYLIAAGVFGLVFLVLPGDLKAIWYSIFGWITVGIAWMRVRKLPLEIRRPAQLIVIAGTISLTGGIVRTVDGMLRGIDYPFPSVADAFAFMPLVLFLVAILTIVHRRVRRFTLDPLIDAVVGGVAVALVQWSVILLPYLRESDAPFAAKATNVVYAVLSLLLVVAAVLALVSGSQRSTSNRLLAAGLVSTFALDIVATLVTAGFLDNDARLYVAPFAFVFGCAGLLHPSVVHLTERPSDPTLLRRLTNRRIATLALALITPPTLIVIGLLRGELSNLVLPGIASLALTPLVVTRLGRLVRQNEELAALEASLRAVGERLVSAETTDDVARIITVGAEQVLGTGFVGGGLVLDPLQAGVEQRSGSLSASIAALSAQLSDDGSSTTAELLPLPAPEPDQYALAGLVVVQRDLKAVLVLVTNRRLTDDETNAVTALCRESAIALRAVEQTEQQVRQRSEDRFAALIDNSSDIVAVLGHDLELLYVSPVAGRLLGYPLDSMDRVSVTDLVHPEDMDVASGMLRDVRFGVRESVELRLRHFAGTYHWFEVVGVDLSSDPNIGGLVLNLREIGDRKQAEERLVLSEARFKALVQHSTDMVVVIDTSGAVRYASPSVDSALGAEPDSLIGRRVQDVFSQSNLDWDAQLGPRSTGERGAPELVEFTFRNHTGDWRTIETSITDLRDEPAVGGVVLNARDVTDRRGMEQRLRYQATHDELTGLANRVQALDDLDGMLGRNSGSTTVAAILIGLDDFKDINDSLGHGFGDRLLVAVAERITGLLGFGDVAARVGGDEFVVVLERAHGENHVTDLADQMLSAIALPYDIDGRELTVSASAGIVFDHDRTNTGEILLRNADIAMYRAKTQGKRQSVVFETQMHTASFDRLELRADLARAITSEQFLAHYQPVVDIETRRIVGAEALIRWDHPQRGLVGPGLFIPLAEESGLIGALGEWILERACTDLARWREEIGEPMMDFTISVNLSVQQLHDEMIVNTVRDILERAGLPAERLVLEVTESTLITETDKIRAVMQQLRALGSRLAVDDFGTGYSSLGYIQQFEFDVLKIDKTFVDGLDSLTNQQIVTAVLDLARQLGVRTIAEGIETELQDGILSDLGCRYGQGYLYSRPVAAADFRELLLADRAGATGRASL
jgi:diguanylate cyclase (GGDEF)-like protein/PAS domain S-box-containing protein